MAGTQRRTVYLALAAVLTAPAVSAVLLLLGCPGPLPSYLLLLIPIAFLAYGVGRAHERLRGARTLVPPPEPQLEQLEKLATLGTLMAGVIHDLNQPLALLTGYTRLLEERIDLLEVEPERTALLSRQLASMAKAAERMGATIGHLQEYVRRSDGIRRAVPLNELARSAMRFVEHDITSRSIELRLELDPERHRVLVDPLQIEQAIVNLLVNARDAVKGSVGGRITLRTLADGGNAILEVSDNGLGVPRQHRSRIFEPFFTTKPAGQGTGLGLALCRDIAQRNGGTVELASGDETGACFRLRFPLASNAHERAHP